MKTREQRFQEAIGILEAKGLSIAAIANAIGTSRQAVNDWKLGKGLANSRAAFVVELAELSGLNARWIINGKGPKNSLSQEQKLLLEGFPLLDESHRQSWIDAANRAINEAAERSKTA